MCIRDRTERERDAFCERTGDGRNIDGYWGDLTLFNKPKTIEPRGSTFLEYKFGHQILGGALQPERKRQWDGLDCFKLTYTDHEGNIFTKQGWLQINARESRDAKINEYKWATESESRREPVLLDFVSTH